MGLSPDEYYADGAVEEFDLANQQLISNVISSIGCPAGLALVPPNVMAVPAADWTSCGLDDRRTPARRCCTSTRRAQSTTDVVPPQAADSVGEIQISGPDNATNTLTIDFSGGSPIPADGIFFDGASASRQHQHDQRSPDSQRHDVKPSAVSITLGQGHPGVTINAESSPGSGQRLACSPKRNDQRQSGGPRRIEQDRLRHGNAFRIEQLSRWHVGHCRKLVVTSSTALPAGTALTVGADATFIFDLPRS